MRTLSVSLFALLSMTGKGIAAPTVVVDIAPVHSLVMQVMGERGEATLLIPPTQSPHEGVLRPSQARAVSSADMVVWVGPGLTPWLGGALDSLGSDAKIVEMLDVAGLEILDIREAGISLPGIEHDHDDEDHDDEHAHEDHDDEHAHEDHDDDHAEGEKHEDHDDGHAHEDHDDHGDGHAHGHEHGNFDAHAWLDPQNAKVWVTYLAQELTEIDPEGGAVYAANAAATLAKLDMLEAEIIAILAPVQDRPYVVLHDAYQYFERHFGLAPPSRLSQGDAVEAGPRAVSNMRSFAAETGIQCFFSEPQFPEERVRVLISNDAQEIHELDPHGSRHEPGPDHYAKTLRDLGAAMAACG